jgi:hypothetical protein
MANKNKIHGNTRYTRDYILKELKEIYRKVKEDKNIIYELQFLAEKEYCRDTFWDWKRKYRKDKEICDFFKKIAENLERNAIEFATKQKNPAFIIFFLKNRYGWTDKQQIEQKISKIKVEIVKPKNDG